MAEGQVLRVQPEVMSAVSQALSGAAKDFQAKLVELDSQLRELLAGWRGDSGGAYAQVWDSWHRGAGEVQVGLSLLAKAVGVTGAEFDTQEQASAQAMDGVYRG